MSYYSTPDQLLNWIDEANFAPITKNKVRKDLLTDLHSICHLVPKPGDLEISSAHLTAILTILKKDGKAEMLNNDELLSFATSVTSLHRSVVRHFDKASLHLASTLQDSLERKFQEHTVSPPVQVTRPVQVQSPLQSTSSFIQQNNP
jgi:hypothetical protein